jgi:5,6-dimethylbenzimidazole synthase
MGWVSLFDPDEVRAMLGMPAGARPVALLCVGQVTCFYAEPMLEREGWASRMPLDACLFENTWPDTSGERADARPEGDASQTV